MRKPSHISVTDDPEPTPNGESTEEASPSTEASDGEGGSPSKQASPREGDPQRFATSEEDIEFGDPMKGIIKDPGGSVVYRIDDEEGMSADALKNETGWEGTYILKTRVTGETKEIEFTMPEIPSVSRTGDSETTRQLEAMKEEIRRLKSGSNGSSGSSRSSESGKSADELEAELRRRKRQLRSARDEIEQLEGEIEKKRRAMRDMREELRNARDDRDRMVSKRDEAQRKRKRVEREMEKVKDERDAYEQQNEKLRERVSRLKEQGLTVSDEDEDGEPSMWETFFEYLTGPQGPLSQEKISALIQQYGQQQMQQQRARAAGGGAAAGGGGAAAAAGGMGQQGVQIQPANQQSAVAQHNPGGQGQSRQGQSQQRSSPSNQQPVNNQTNPSADSAGGVDQAPENNAPDNQGQQPQAAGSGGQEAPATSERDEMIGDMFSYIRENAEADFLSDKYKINIETVRDDVREQIEEIRGAGYTIQIQEWAMLFEVLTQIVRQAEVKPEVFTDRFYPVFRLFHSDLQLIKGLGAESTANNVVSMRDSMDAEDGAVLQRIVQRLFDRMDGTAERPGEDDNLPPGMSVE